MAGHGEGKGRGSTGTFCSGPDGEPVVVWETGGAFVLFEVGKDVDEIEDFAGKFLEREGEVGHARGDFFLLHVAVVEREIVVVEVL